MNNIELNAVLYYADFLSLKATNHPVTDNCKYFFIHGAPINSLFILDLEPEYDQDNEYFKQALVEYMSIKHKYGEDGVESFIDDICSIKACGSVDAERMLKCIHQYSNKYEKRLAQLSYYEWVNNQIYKHTTITEDGIPIERECTKYTYHVERMLGRRSMVEGAKNYRARYEILT